MYRRFFRKSTFFRTCVFARYFFLGFWWSNKNQNPVKIWVGYLTLFPRWKFRKESVMRFTPACYLSFRRGALFRTCDFPLNFFLVLCWYNKSPVQIWAGYLTLFSRWNFRKESVMRCTPVCCLSFRRGELYRTCDFPLNFFWAWVGLTKFLLKFGRCNWPCFRDGIFGRCRLCDVRPCAVYLSAGAHFSGHAIFL